MIEKVSSTLISLTASAAVCWVIIVTSSLHKKYTHDLDLSAVQKYHQKPVPRIGGLAVLLGLICGGIYHGLEADQELHLAKWAGVAAVPVFLGGILEDLNKGMTARDRLLLAFFSATIAHYELNVGLQRIDWAWFDSTIIPVPGVTLLLTVIMVGGLAHAANIIDGFNGLLLGVAIMALGAFIWVAYQIGNAVLVTYMSILFGAMLGVFLFNYPYGKIFLGDGGAYLIGFLLAILGLILVKQHPTVSPWFPLTVLVYPVTETLFSMFRKKVISKTPAMMPDKYHFHMLVHDRIIVRIRGRSSRHSNSITTLVMWGLFMFGLIPGVIWWDRTPYLLAALSAFVLLYVFLYIWLNKRQPVDSCS